MISINVTLGLNKGKLKFGVHTLYTGIALFDFDVLYLLWTINMMPFRHVICSWKFDLPHQTIFKRDLLVLLTIFLQSQTHNLRLLILLMLRFPLAALRFKIWIFYFSFAALRGDNCPSSQWNVMCRPCCEYHLIQCRCPSKGTRVGYTVPCCRNVLDECDPCIVHPGKFFSSFCFF